MSSEFEKLAGELEVLAKAQGGASEEDKVLEAAKEAGVDTDAIGQPADGAGEDAGAAGGEGDGDGDGDDEVLGKSFQVMGASGAPVKAYDATELIKSLMARVETAETSLADVAERREHLGKSLGLITDLLKSQAEQIDSLQKAITDMGGKGRGRQAVLTISEKPATTLAKAQPSEGMNRTEFLAKAETALKAGRISGHEMSLTEAYMNKGMLPPEALVSRVMALQ